MKSNNLSGKQWTMFLAIVIVVGLVAGFVGSFVGTSITGNTIRNYRNAVKLSPSGNSRVDSWFPYSDGNVYLTADGANPRGGGFIFRQRVNNTYNTLAEIDSNGRFILSDSLANPNNSSSSYPYNNTSQYAYACLDDNGVIIRRSTQCN